MERTCAETIDRNVVDPVAIDGRRIGEISRLAIVSEFRRRNGEKHTAIAVSEADFGALDLPRFPYIQVALYLGTIALAKRSGIETLFVLTEPRLSSHFSKLGRANRADRRTGGAPRTVRALDDDGHLDRVKPAAIRTPIVRTSLRRDLERVRGATENVTFKNASGIGFDNLVGANRDAYPGSTEKGFDVATIDDN